MANIVHKMKTVKMLKMKKDNYHTYYLKITNALRNANISSSNIQNK